MEPLQDHPAELQRFVTEELEAPFIGTDEAKKAATATVFASFPGMEERAKQMVREKEAKVAAARAEARAAAEAAEGADTPDPYPGPVDRSDDARGDA